MRERALLDPLRTATVDRDQEKFVRKSDDEGQGEGEERRENGLACVSARAWRRAWFIRDVM